MPAILKSPLDKAHGHEVIWSQVSELFDAARPYADMKYVYVIGEEDEGALKVGATFNPFNRLRAMQIGNPRRLRVEHVLAGDMRIEKLLHEIWEQYAIIAVPRRGKADVSPGTEWFRPEIREELLPVISTAAAKQAALLRTGVEAEDGYAEMERLVREAHGQHDVVAHRRHETRLLAAGPGYVVRRRSRI